MYCKSKSTDSAYENYHYTNLDRFGPTKHLPTNLIGAYFLELQHKDNWIVVADCYIWKKLGIMYPVKDEP